MSANAGNRTKNVSRIAIFGFLYKFVCLILPFITRTLILYLLGTSSLGIGSLFSSILSFLSLAELGFGSTIVYAMYKPISENDIETIGALLKYFRKIYRLVGITVLVIGALLMPFLPELTKKESVDGINIYVLFSIYLTNSVISYFFAGYKQSLLTAHQRGDIIYKIATVVTILVRLSEIFAIYFTKSLYVYAFMSIIGTVITNVIISIVTNRMYPEIKCKGEISNDERLEIKKRITGLIGTNMNSVVVNQADNIVISYFLGLTVVAVYGNYLTIYHAVTGFIMMFFNSMTSSIGNKLVTDNIENSYTLFKKISFINYWIVGWCSICMLCLYQPFMELWVGKNLMLPLSTVILISFYLYIYQIQRAILIFKDAAGLWYEDRFRPYVSMIFNLVSNIILVQFMGLNGVVISSIIAFFMSIIWCNNVVFKHLFCKSTVSNLIEMLKHTIVTIFVAVGTYFLCSIMKNGIVGLIERAIICIVVPNLIYMFIYHRTIEFRNLLQLVSNRFNLKKLRG